ncbi:hypothetical protein F5Y05DRAFT_391575 [Hypoxylon sp. FL0543]|nr:hypothetical protein F5Y05DRAFT_391575 [Hypoxylon sp. FL0543]
MDKMSTAQEKVFGTTELLERIILDIEPRDILVNVQRVSKRFKDVIDGSCKIQQVISPFLLLSDPYGRIMYGVNPLVKLHHTFKPWPTDLIKRP